MTIGVIGRKVRGFLEKRQDAFDNPQIKLDRREKREKDYITSIERGTEMEVVPTQLLQQTPGFSPVNQGVEALHHRTKIMGERRSPYRRLRPWQIRSLEYH
jgi:hypothetical protein